MSDNTNETLGETPAEPSKLGWLQQFERFGVEEFDKLRAVVEQGLTPSETQVLIWTAKELILLAQKHEPEAFAKVKALLDETQT